MLVKSRVLAVRRVEAPAQSVYNLEVADNNNYFADGVLVHNCHGAAAHAYASFLNRLDARHKMGLSATPARKDGRHFIVRDVLGPVTAVSETVAMVPQIEVFETGIAKKGPQQKTWHGMLKFLNGSKERLVLIVRKVFEDLRAGHKAIIIPVEWRQHQKDIVEAINKQAAVNRVKRSEKWPKDLAVAFHGEAQRQQILDLVDDDSRPTVLVSIRKMVRQGIDFKRPTMLYIVIPMSGKVMIGAPLFDQLSNRVCTPVAGKRIPVIRIFVDKHGISIACFKGLFKHEIAVKLKPKNGRPVKYAIDAENMMRARSLIQNDRNRDDDGPSYGEEESEQTQVQRPRVHPVAVKW